jgi:hypothetical protein
VTPFRAAGSELLPRRHPASSGFSQRIHYLIKWRPEPACRGGSARTGSALFLKKAHFLSDIEQINPAKRASFFVVN